MAVLLLSGAKAHAQNHSVQMVVPGHVYVVPGFSFRSGDYLVLEPSGLCVFGPIAPPVAVVARPMLGVGGSGVGLGLALNPFPESMRPYPGGLPDPDFFLGPFISLEAHVERMYSATSWRHATYAGPQLSLSVLVLKVSMGWMIDVGDHTDHHLQFALGFGF